MLKILRKLKYILWTTKEWGKRLYQYPQEKIIPGKHFDYDAYWKEKRGKYMGGLGRWQGKRADMAAAIISTHNGKSVNDIGSGAGEVLSVIKQKAHLTSAVAYDSSSYALETAREMGLETQAFDINKESDFALIRPADFTILFEILEHVPGSEALLKAAYDNSRIGVLFSFPNTGFFVHRVRLFFFGRFPLQWKKHPGEHLRFMTKRDLLWWLKAQDYKKYKVHYYVGVPFLKRIWPAMFAAGFFVELLK
jgi:SAM-dependent methyltransferase